MDKLNRLDMELKEETKMYNMDTKLRDWYMENFPTDDLGNEINPDATFQDLFDTLDSYGNVYKTIGIGDSIIRERLFAGLAEIMGVNYEYIYEQWML